MHIRNCVVARPWVSDFPARRLRLSLHAEKYSRWPCALSYLQTTTAIKRILYGSASSLHPLGSTSWCTHYSSARKRTYSNQPTFLLPEQNGRRFNWRPSGVGVPRCSTRSVWAPWVQSMISSGPRGRCTRYLGHQYLSTMPLLDDWQLCWSSGHQNGFSEVGVLL
jgi:hypothetical protein